MIVLDTTVLVYAVGARHTLLDPCREIVSAVADGRLEATTTVEAIQEFAHVRARRRGRADAAALSLDYVELLSPLLTVTPDDLRGGLAVFAREAALSGFDAVSRPRRPPTTRRRSSRQTRRSPRSPTSVTCFPTPPASHDSSALILQPCRAPRPEDLRAVDAVTGEDHREPREQQDSSANQPPPTSPSSKLVAPSLATQSWSASTSSSLVKSG